MRKTARYSWELLIKIQTHRRAGLQAKTKSDTIKIDTLVHNSVALEYLTLQLGRNLGAGSD